jgi:molecular chaperone DnaJ
MGLSPDYYTVLGIRRTESPAAIRRAFRRLVVRYHPDRAGAQEARRFQEIVEAYRVLSDPAQREAYTQTSEATPLGSAEVGVRFSVVDVSPRMPSPEPLSLFHDFHAPQSEIREVFDRWSRNFTHLGVPKAERVKPLDLDVILSPEEAERGTNLSIALPAIRRCETCGGSGRDWLFPCIPCGGQGMVEEERLVELRLPRAVVGESIYEVPLRHLGVENLYLRIRLRVTG